MIHIRAPVPIGCPAYFSCGEKIPHDILRLWTNSLPLSATSAIGVLGNSEPNTERGRAMPKKKATGESIYKVIQLVGTSTVSWEDAAKKVVETASKSLRDLRVAEITQLDLKIEDGKVVAYRARVNLSFKYEAGK